MQLKSEAVQTHHAVLVLGRDIRAFLTVVRSLGRAGLQVHVGMCPADDLALKSKYIFMYHDIPEYSPDSSEWLERLTELSKKYHYKLIVPTHDESAIPMQLFHDQLSDHAGIYSLDSESFDIAFDKIKSSNIAAELGIKLPMQTIVTMETLRQGLPEGFKMPVVIKPSSSYLSSDLGVRREVKMIKGHEFLLDTVEKHQDWGEVLVQEVFKGVGTGVEVLANKGEILAVFQHTRVHEPLNGGASSYRKSSPINSELRDATEKLMRRLNYTGVAMVEFKINPESNDWIFIEINGRFWGSLPLAFCSGLDFLYFLIALLVNE